MHEDNFVVDIAASKAFSTTTIPKNKQNINIIKGLAPTWAIAKFLYGKCVSGWWNGNTNFVITINSNR